MRRQMASQSPQVKTPKTGDSLSVEGETSPVPRGPNNTGNDFFCEAADAIDVLGRTDRPIARPRWKALKESAETDDSVGGPSELLTAEAIAKDMNHPVAALVKLKILLSIRQSYDYAKQRPELNAALPPSLSAYERSFQKRFKEKLGRQPHNYGSKKRKRYALTYAELLHMFDAVGLELAGELDGELSNRLEAF